MADIAELPKTDIGWIAAAIYGVTQVMLTPEGQKVMGDLRSVNLTLVDGFKHLIGKDNKGDLPK